MISFVTILLGLAFGPRPIEVQAGPGVASVEFRLDGQTLRVLEAPPWKTVVDLGPPMPHELVAIARDAGRVEVGRAVQLANVPRPSQEATLTLLPGTGGKGRIVRLAWASPLKAKPAIIELSLDGRPLKAGDLSRIPLPDYRSADVHVVRAVLDLGRGSRVPAELLVGGVRREAADGPDAIRGETQAELTAVPVVFPGSAPKESEMNGWFLADGAPMRVEAVEESPGEIVVVKDERAGPWLARLKGIPFVYSGNETRLREGQRLRFCWPATLSPADTAPGYDVFLRSQDFVAPQNVGRLLLEVPPPAASGPPRLGDAVNVAALSAAAGNRPRAVLLVLAGPGDGSEMPVEWTRGFLRALRVPLFVWTNDRKTASAWGTANVLSTIPEFRNAIAALTKAVESQRIVWLEGRHLPQSISLSPEARGVTLVE
jgi:hypothetical protein